MLRIKGKEQEQSLSVSLAGILNCIDDGADHKWMVQTLEAMGSRPGINVPKLQETINKSAHGVLYTFEELIEFESLFDKITGFLVIGDTDTGRLDRYDTAQARYSHCDYVLELVDEGYWKINTENYRALANIQKLEDVITY